MKAARGKEHHLRSKTNNNMKLPKSLTAWGLPWLAPTATQDLRLEDSPPTIPARRTDRNLEGWHLSSAIRCFTSRAGTARIQTASAFGSISNPGDWEVRILEHLSEHFTGNWASQFDFNAQADTGRKNCCATLATTLRLRAC